MMLGYGSSWAWWQAGLGWIGMIAFWALLIWVVYLVVSRLTQRPGEPGHGGPQPPDARRILDERLARGEVDPDEYRRLRETLEGRAVATPRGADRRR